MSDAYDEFVLTNTVIGRAPLVPECRLHLAGEVTPLWHATEETLAREGLPPPFWAFAWPGSQALARFVLDNPQTVAGKKVLDFASGSGLVAIAAARCGAAEATANDIDPFALVAQRLNARLNDTAIKTICGDLVDDSVHDSGHAFDAILAGDVCYEGPMARRAAAWLSGLAADGKTVLLADPGRSFLPTSGLQALVRYAVPTSLDLENRETMETVVYQLRPEPM